MTPPTKHVIETHGLGKAYGQVQALRGLDLRVPRNSIFGFLGPNGAGKTTTMKLLLGLIHPTSGSGTVFGVSGLAVHTLFYLALTLMMGVLASSRGVLLGVTLDSLLLGVFAGRLLGSYAPLTPWAMASALPAFALGMALSRPIWVPLAATASLTLLCAIVALWRFERMEF